MKRFAMFLVLWASALNAATVSFDVLPTGGSISGTAGSTIGWGYSLTNDSPDQWLVPVELNATPFAFGTPFFLFDFPILAPGTTVTRSFDPVARTGLLELVLNRSVATPVVSTGYFALIAEWWDGDPLAGGAYVEEAGALVASYQATAEPAAAVPEPSGALLMLLGCAGLGAVRLQRYRANAVAVARRPFRLRSDSL